MKLVIDIAATDRTNSAVTSLTNATPVSAIQSLVFGDTEPLDITFTDSSASPMGAPSWAGAAGYALVVGLGSLDANAQLSYAATSTFATKTAGWTGNLQLNGASLQQAVQQGTFNGVGYYPMISTDPRVRNARPNAVWFWLQIQVYDTNSNPVSYALVRVAMLNRTLASSTPAALAAGPTAYFVLNYPAITGLLSVSQSATKLGGLTTAGGAMPTGAQVSLNFAVSIVNDDSSTTAGLLTLNYQLLSGTTATAWPVVGRPYDYNASTNTVYWQLVSAALGYQPASYNSVTSKFHRNYVYGSANAAAVSCDQIGTSAPA